MKEFIISREKVSNLAKELLPIIKKNRVVLLDGEMGAGKTTLIQAFAKELDEKKVVSSPTFNVMNVYDAFVHLDAYKISGSLEQYEDYFGDKIVFIEWAQNIAIQFNRYLKITIKIIDLETRKYIIEEN